MTHRKRTYIIARMLYDFHRDPESVEWGYLRSEDIHDRQVIAAFTEMAESYIRHASNLEKLQEAVGNSVRSGKWDIKQITRACRRSKAYPPQ